MTPNEIRRTLRTLRPPPRNPTPLREEMADALIAARRFPDLAADWRIAEASLQHPDALPLLEEALTFLTAQRHDDLCYVHEQLATLRRAGGDPNRARQHLQAALDIARGHDPDAQKRLAMRMGGALLSAGLPQEAEPLIKEALELAIDRQDPLIELGASTTLAALRIEAGDTAAGILYGARTAILGARRGNWIAVADGLITQAVCHDIEGDWEQSILVILHGASRLRDAAAIAALNLLQAYLIDLRTRVGEEDFDTRFEAIGQMLDEENRVK